MGEVAKEKNANAFVTGIEPCALFMTKAEGAGAKAVEIAEAMVKNGFKVLGPLTLVDSTQTDLRLTPVRMRGLKLAAPAWVALAGYSESKHPKWVLTGISPCPLPPPLSP